MGLERLKFWHWMIIGVLVGVGYGFVKTQLLVAEETSEHTRDRGQIEHDLQRGAIVRNLTLHPPVEGQEWVTGEIYQFNRANGLVSVYPPREINPNLPPGWRARPRGGRWNRNAANNSPPAQPPEGPTTRPDLPDGKWLTLTFLAGDANRKGKEYNVAGTITANGTTATFTAVNGHSFRNGDTVTIAGAAQPEYNGAFKISNVTRGSFDYTLPAAPSATTATAGAGGAITAYMDAREFLASLQRQFPPVASSHRDLEYRFAWWEVPVNAMAIYGAGGFVVIGVIWPTVISLMAGAGLVKRPEPEDDYDLSRFKGGEEANDDAKPEVSQQDQDQLAELNAKLEAGVADMLQGSTEPEIDHDAEHAAAIKKLETTAMDAEEGAVAQSNEPKEYRGEFYPVAKPVVHKDEKK